MGQGDTWLNGVIGAVITIALSFTGFSPLLGGAVAGYLQEAPPKQGVRVGAISGGVAIIPMFLLLVGGFGVIASVSEAGMGVPGGFEIAIFGLVLVPMLLVWFVGLSAVGGYIGAYIREEVN